MIGAGRVMVNGKIATIGDKAIPQVDTIQVDGQSIGQAESMVYLKLHKPAGYLTSMSDDRGRAVITDLITDIPERVYPVGRLDYNTEGVLLLTNDGVLAHALAHPSNQVPRTYHIKVRGNPTPSQFKKLTTGVTLEDGVARAISAERIRTTPAGHLWFEMVLAEGKNREVRRMCEAIGHPVNRLLRVNFAGIHVDDLRPGETKVLTKDQVNALYNMVNLTNSP